VVAPSEGALLTWPAALRPAPTYAFCIGQEDQAAPTNAFPQMSFWSGLLATVPRDLPATHRRRNATPHWRRAMGLGGMRTRERIRSSRARAVLADPRLE